MIISKLSFTFLLSGYFIGVMRGIVWSHVNIFCWFISMRRVWGVDFLCMWQSLVSLNSEASAILSTSLLLQQVSSITAALCLRSEQFASLLRETVQQKNLRYSVCRRSFSPAGARVSYPTKLPACGQFCEIAPQLLFHSPSRVFSFSAAVWQDRKHWYDP